MTQPAAKEIEATIDKVFEIQATINLLGRRLEGIASSEAIDTNEVMNLSRVTDLCARTLDNVASVLDRMKPSPPHNPTRLRNNKE